MEDVAIIGVGMHPFGRFGTKSEDAAERRRARHDDPGSGLHPSAWVNATKVDLDIDIKIGRMAPET